MQQFHFRIVARIKWDKHILITFASLVMNEEADAETRSLVSDHLGVASNPGWCTCRGLLLTLLAVYHQGDFQMFTLAI